MRFLTSSAALFVLITFSTPLLAQSSIHLKNGIVIETEFEIIYREGDDMVRIIEDNSRISASEINLIISNEGTTLESRSIGFFNKRTNADLFKTAFLKRIAEGQIGLFSYEGRDFRFVLERNNQLTVLLKLTDKEAQLTSFLNYQSILLTTFTSCDIRTTAEQTNLTQNQLLNLVNSYNECLNSNYVPLVEAKEKKVIRKFGANFGINSANLDIFVPVIAGVSTVVDTVGNNGLNSNRLAFSISYQQNINGSESLFLDVGLDVRPTEFQISTTGARTLDNDIIKMNLFYAKAGLSYSYKLNNLISTELTGGAFYWNSGNMESITYRELDIVDPAGRQFSGVGFYFKPTIEFNVSNKVSLVVAAELNELLQKEVFTFDKEEYEYGPFEVFHFAEDKLYRNFFFQIGFRVNSLTQKL